jgi:hypothetical protein
MPVVVIEGSDKTRENGSPTQPLAQETQRREAVYEMPDQNQEMRTHRDFSKHDWL